MRILRGARSPSLIRYPPLKYRDRRDADDGVALADGSRVHQRTGRHQQNARKLAARKRGQDVRRGEGGDAAAARAARVGILLLAEEAWQRDGAHETVTLTYVGNAEAFQYSDVTFEGITPAEDFVITDKSQNKFVVKFSGAVDMVENLTFINMGQGATQAFESIVANDDKTEYTLTIAESVLETLRNEVYIVFAANDAEGKRVQGNNGEEENSCFAYSFKTVIGVPDLTVTPDATAEQASLSVFSIKCAEGLVPSWTANVTLTDANGNTIALGEPEPVVAEGADEWATPTEWTVALKEELKTVGAYTLTIPAGCFNIGNTQGQVMGNKETVVVFNITENAQGINAVTVDSEVVVYNIAGVAVANGKASEVLKDLNKGIYIVNGKKFVVK